MARQQRSVQLHLSREFLRMNDLLLQHGSRGSSSRRVSPRASGNCGMSSTWSSSAPAIADPSPMTHRRQILESQERPQQQRMHLQKEHEQEWRLLKQKIRLERSYHPNTQFPRRLIKEQAEVRQHHRSIPPYPNCGILDSYSYLISRLRRNSWLPLAVCSIRLAYTVACL
jgi:hypothetical protein